MRTNLDIWDTYLGHRVYDDKPLNVAMPRLDHFGKGLPTMREKDSMDRISGNSQPDVDHSWNDHTGWRTGCIAWEPESKLRRF